MKAKIILNFEKIIKKITKTKNDLNDKAIRVK